MSPDVFTHGWNANHDGGGLAYSHMGKLFVEKPFFKKAAFEAAYRKAHAIAGATNCIMVHFRWASHGEKSTLNTHPHILNGGEAALIHNGILSGFTPEWKAKHSDTVQFIETVLAHRPTAQLTDATFCAWLGEIIGSRNKFVILDYVGNCRIVNEKHGVWDCGVWYSNNSYSSPPSPAPKGESTSFGGSGKWDDYLANYGKGEPLSPPLIPPGVHADTPDLYASGEASYEDFEAYCEYYGYDIVALEQEIEEMWEDDDDFQTTMERESWADECKRVNLACKT